MALFNELWSLPPFTIGQDGNTCYLNIRLNSHVKSASSGSCVSLSSPREPVFQFRLCHVPPHTLHGVEHCAVGASPEGAWPRHKRVLHSPGALLCELVALAWIGAYFFMFNTKLQYQLVACSTS